MPGPALACWSRSPRSLFRPALRADWGPYFAEIQYWGTGGGAYNTLIDRDVLMMWAGVRF